MYRFTWVLIFCLVYFSCHWKVKSQPRYKQVIDSLLIVIQTTSQDTNRVKIYGDLSFNYAGTRTELDLALAYADSMRALSEKLHYEPGIAQSHMYYGYYDRYSSNYAGALEHFQIYVNYYNGREDELMAARGLFQISNVHLQLGNYEESLATAEQTLKINEKHQQWNGVVATLNSIGIIYKRTGKYEKAIACYEKAVAVNDSFHLKRDLTFILMNTANSYTLLEEYDKALGYYEKSLKVSYDANSQYGIASNLTNIGSTYYLMKQYQKSLDTHVQALRIWETLPNKMKLATSQLETGKTLVKLNRFPSARKHLEDGLVLAKKVEAKDIIRDAYMFMADLYVSMNDYQEAYKFEKLYHGMRDSIFSEDNVKQINELQTKYETAEKDKQISQLAYQNEIQERETQRQSTLKKAFIGGLILITLLAGSVIYTTSQRLKHQRVLAEKDKEIKEVNFKKQLSELEMKALRAQINPHFLYNCINSINRMILEKENVNASQYLAKFSKLVRLILENAEKPTVSLQNELAMLEAYINLESLRFKGKINYTISIDKSVDPDATYLPSMVLQPFVENAIWHGLMNKKNGDEGMIKISVKEENEILNCAIEDNGIGREAARELREKSVLQTKSMGMKITEERLKLIAKEGWKRLINIIDLKDQLNRAVGTRVEITIPLHNQV